MWPSLYWAHVKQYVIIVDWFEQYKGYENEIPSILHHESRGKLTITIGMLVSFSL